MKMKILFFVIAMFFVKAVGAENSLCKGKFPNPVSDVCWSCMFPIKLGASPIMGADQPDMDSGPSSPICFCWVSTYPIPPEQIILPGIEVGFYEPLRSADVTRTPWCMVNLGGTSFDPGLERPRGAQHHRGNTQKSSFYHIHWYFNPILNWMDVILDFVKCTDKAPFDVAYMSEVDPLHNDEEAATFIEPDVFLLSSLPATIACVADCALATFGMGISALYWCAGCQGNMYPLTGHVGEHQGGVMASTLMVERLAAKLHRLLLAKAAYASSDEVESLELGDAPENSCPEWFEPIMNKQQYKLQMTYPVPSTSKIGNSCCAPFGRTTILWGAGKEFPEEGEDFGYLVFRKRNCCVTVTDF